MSFIFIAWIILTVLLSLYPIIFLSRYGGVIFSSFFSYVYKHIQDIKGLKKFHASGFMETIRGIDMQDSTSIFDSSEDKDTGNLGENTITIEKNISETENVLLDLNSAASIGSESTTERVEKSVKKDVPSYSMAEDMRMENQRNKARIESIKADALTLKNRGQFDEYEKKLIEGMALESDCGYFKIQLADWYFHMGNYNKALTLLKQILVCEPRNHKALRQVGEIHLEKGEFDLAKVLVDKAIELSPQNPKYYVSLVEIFYNMDKVDEAIAIMLKVVKLRPKNVSYLIGLAGLYEKVGDEEEMKLVYMKVIQLDPSNEKARKRLKLFS